MTRKDPPKPDGETPKRRRRKEARPSEILVAAIEEFADAGFARAKIADIAKRAGVAKGTVYLYYETKADLFEAIVRDQVSPVFRQVQSLADSWPGSSADLLKGIITRFYEQMIEDPHRRMILKTLIAESDKFQELAAFYHKEILSRAKKVLRLVLQRGVDAGEFRDSPILKEPLLVASPCLLVAIWKMTFEPVEKLNAKRFMEAHLDLVIHGLQA